MYAIILHFQVQCSSIYASRYTLTGSEYEHTLSSVKYNCLVVRIRVKQQLVVSDSVPHIHPSNSSIVVLIRGCCYNFMSFLIPLVQTRRVCYTNLSSEYTFLSFQMNIFSVIAVLYINPLS